MQRSVTAHSANTVVAPLAFLTLMFVDAIFLIQKYVLSSCVSSFLYFVVHTLIAVLTVFRYTHFSSVY